jgi:hypothetical protein
MMMFALKQQSAGTHITPLRHITLIMSEPVCALTPKYCIHSKEAADTNFKMLRKFACPAWSKMLQLRKFAFPAWSKMLQLIKFAFPAWSKMLRKFAFPTWT